MRFKLPSNLIQYHRDRNKHVIQGDRGATVEQQFKSVESGTFTGATFTVSAAIPAGSFVLGVTIRVLVDVTGSGLTSVDVGDGTAADEFLDNAVPLTVGSTWNLAVGKARNSPKIYRAATDIVFTPVGAASFTGGKVLILIHYLQFGAPTG